MKNTVNERTYPLQTRIDEDLRAKLEAAAAANLRAVSAEAYMRLKASFEPEGQPPILNQRGEVVG